MSIIPSRYGYIWLVPLILSLFVLLDGIAFLLLGGGTERDTILRITGYSWDQIESTFPGIAHYINNLAIIIGLTFVGFALMMIAISITGYRTAKKWAWFFAWYLPVYFLASGILTFLEGEHISLEPLSADSLFAFFALSILAQLISIRWFFPPKKTKGMQNTS